MYPVQVLRVVGQTFGAHHWIQLILLSLCEPFPELYHSSFRRKSHFKTFFVLPRRKIRLYRKIKVLPLVGRTFGAHHWIQLILLSLCEQFPDLYFLSFGRESGFKTRFIVATDGESESF